MTLAVHVRIAILLCLFFSFPFFVYSQIQTGISPARARVSALRNSISNHLKINDHRGLSQDIDDLFKVIENDTTYLVVSKPELNTLLFLTDKFDSIFTKQTNTKIYYSYNGKFRAKMRPAKDDLPDVLSQKIIADHDLISKKILSGNYTVQQKEQLKLYLDYVTNVLSHDLFPTEKQLLKEYKNYISKYKADKSDPCIRCEIPYYLKYIRIGAYFGGGLTIGSFTSALKPMFTTPTGYEMNFDWYYNRLGWYSVFSISNFKNKFDTLFNNKRWPKNTKDFITEFQAGISLILLKTTFTRTTLKVGIGTFVIKAVQSDNLPYPETKSIKLKSIPEFSFGLSSDIGRFDHNFKKWPKAPVSFRLFYRYNLLIGKNIPVDFKGNIQNFGILFGIGG